MPHLVASDFESHLNHLSADEGPFCLRYLVSMYEIGFCRENNHLPCIWTVLDEVHQGMRRCDNPPRPRRKKVTEIFFYRDWISAIESSWEGVSTVKISHWFTPPSWRYTGSTYEQESGTSEVLDLYQLWKKRKDTQPWIFHHRKEHTILSRSNVSPGHRSRFEIYFWSTESM
jgi:hypothetical protein